jgi:hypothetical protein
VMNLERGDASSDDKRAKRHHGALDFWKFRQMQSLPNGSVNLV